jgi:general secretion pathway protein D
MGRALAAAVVLSGVLGSGQPSAAQPSAREQAYTFAFRDADVGLVAQEVLGAIGVPFAIDPSVSGRISFRIDQRLTKAQLLQAFETALAANNIAVTANGDMLTLTSRAKARAGSGVRPAGEGVARAGYEVVAAPVAFAVPSEAAKALEAITGPGVVLHANDKLGLIVLAGSGQQLQSAIESLKVFDQSGLENARIRWFELSQAPASQVATELEAMLRAAGMSGVRIAPLRRLNGLILFSNSERALEQVAQWVPRLDAPVREAASSLWVYHPKNTSAEALARTLNSVTGAHAQLQQETATGGGREAPPARADTEPGRAGAVSSTLTVNQPEDQVRAAVDKETNTLLVSAPAWRWVQLQRVLAEIDRPQAQVLIEATVLEVTLRNEFQLGVDWSVLSASGEVQVGSIGNDTGEVGARFPGFSVTFLGDDVQAAVNALGGRTAVEVVSAPKLLTLDNRTARLQVGDQVPIVVQTARSVESPNAPVLNSVEYRNSGIILHVTPRISGADRVTLEVSQEVSSVVRTQTSGIDSPTIQQRRLESTLVLTDGGVVALGGLISRSRDRINSGVPGLKDIPAVGYLFRSTTRNDGRTELIVLLKARIIRDAAAATEAMGALKSDLRELQARGLLDGR